MRPSLLCVILIWLLGTVSFAAPTALASEANRGEFIGAMPTVYPPWFKESFLDFHDDIRDAAASNRRMAVLFHQDGCPYCNVLVEKNLAQKDIQNYLRKHFDIVALNMWGDREVVAVGGESYTEKELAAVLKVQYTPTLLFFAENGDVALRVDGYLPPAQFKIALEYAEPGTSRKVSLRDFAAQRGPPRKRGGPLNSQPFFMPAPVDLAARPGRNQRPLVVIFEQQECPNCDALHDGILSTPSAQELLSGFDVVQVDMWSREKLTALDGTTSTARELADQLGISYAPSLVVFDTQGKEVIRTDAYLKRFHTESLLDYVASGAYRHEPSFQRFISERADALREQGVDVNIWQ
jgi:thioredoxin-related protein